MSHSIPACSPLRFAILIRHRVLHFVLFVWACVDTRRYRHRSVDERAAAMAAAVVTRMQQTGQWGPHQNGAGMQYPPSTHQPNPVQGEMKNGQWQPYPQQYPQQWQQNGWPPMAEQKPSTPQEQVSQNAEYGRQRDVPHDEEKGGARGFYEPDSAEGAGGLRSGAGAGYAPEPTPVFAPKMREGKGKGRVLEPTQPAAGPYTTPRP